MGGYEDGERLCFRHQNKAEFNAAGDGIYCYPVKVGIDPNNREVKSTSRLIIQGRNRIRAKATATIFGIKVKVIS